MRAAAICSMVLRPIDEYSKKVAEIALSQCRCATGADLVTNKPKDGARLEEHAKAA